MLSINKLRKRNISSSNTNNSDDIHSQYIEDYQLYFDNALNKTKYKDYYDEKLLGECILLDVSTSNLINGDEKYLTTLPNDNLFIGQILELSFQDNDIEHWLLTDKEHLAILSHKKFKVRPCNYILKWMYKGVLYKIPCIVSNQTKYTLGVSTQVAGISEGSSRYQILMSFNYISKVIDEGQRFIFNNNAWKTTQVDFISDKGLLSILLGQDSINTEIDNTDLEVAGYYANKHTYTYNIPTSFEVSKDNAYQLLYSIKDEIGKDFDYSLVTATTTTNNTLVNITNNKGIITIKGIGIGTGSIKLSVPIGETTKDFNINFEVKAIVPDKITYDPDFSQGTMIKQYVTDVVTISRFKNGIQDNTLKINYSFDTNTQTLINSKKIIITKVSDSSFTIKNALVTVKTIIYVTVNDVDTGTKVLDNFPLTLINGI
jgi:hypothetical protein